MYKDHQESVLAAKAGADGESAPNDYADAEK